MQWTEKLGYWLTKLKRQRNLFGSGQNVMREGAAWMAGGRLFHACGAATGTGRSPKVDHLMGGMIRVVVADERK